MVVALFTETVPPDPPPPPDPPRPADIATPLEVEAEVPVEPLETLAPGSLSSAWPAVAEVVTAPPLPPPPPTDWT